MTAREQRVAARSALTRCGRRQASTPPPNLSTHPDIPRHGCGIATFRAGAKAPECAGVIHSDLQRGFIRAEVIRWDELLAIGSWNRAKEQGKLRVEGKDYEVQDGDVLEIRFNV